MLSDKLTWRYATKHYDVTKKVFREDIRAIVECGRMSPSSYGLEPWMFYVISKQEIKDKIFHNGFKQPQFAECSHMIVVCAKHKITRKDVRQYISRIAMERGVSLETLQGFKKSLMMALILVRCSGFLKNPFAIFTEMRSWCERQTYIALGFMLAAAAERNIDSCPHEGFIPRHVAKTVNCKSGYSPIAILTLGYRSKDDETQHWRKVRKDYQKVVVEM